MERLERWLKDGRRTATIKANSFFQEIAVDIFVYDYGILEGKTIKNLDELINLDLEQVKEERELDEFRRLGVKYGAEKGEY